MSERVVGVEWFVATSPLASYDRYSAALDERDAREMCALDDKHSPQWAPHRVIKRTTIEEDVTDARA